MDRTCGAPQNNALQLTRARFAQQVRAARHSAVATCRNARASFMGPSQLNAVFDGRVSRARERGDGRARRWPFTRLARGG
jgi:hypothetical protein